MRVLKIQLEGVTASFRYPHFMWGKHPTFLMPPPATIYGHICSALGDWIEPEGILFAYVFTHNGIHEDLEHCITLQPSTGRFPREGEFLEMGGLRKNLEGNINPLKREFLFQPRLTLYINRPDWVEAFRHPHYPVLLGRSQDLATYTQVTTTELRPADHAYYEHTLLPWSWRTRTIKCITYNMPRYVDYRNGRRAFFRQYLALTERVEDLLEYEDKPISHWVETTSQERDGKRRGLVPLSFVGEEPTDWHL